MQAIATTPFNLLDHGAAYHPGIATPLLPALEAIIADLPGDKAGLRLHGIPQLAERLAAAPIATLVGNRRPVRAILFDKSDATNWSLGWHQDRTIAVRRRIDVPGFGPWSVKQGMQHVEPPFAVIEAMRTLRIHLDPVPHDNAPLLIAPGSHCLGRISEAGIDAVVETHGVITCLADAGDVWAYATPILHASAAATPGRHRRVLQVDFSADILPRGLEWLGL